MTLQSRIEAAISANTNQHARIIDSLIAHGGCINDSRIVALIDGRRFFIKSHTPVENRPGFFQAEYEALLLLAQPNVIQVPRPIAYDDDFIVLEVFDAGNPASDWQEQMGRSLANLHKFTQKPQFGFIRDNYLGTNIQINTWQDNWLTFWREQRLACQLKMLATKMDKDNPLLINGDKLLCKLDSILGDIEEPAVLLHGDLWSGNAAADKQGKPVIFDPASYYGHREAEMGMMRLFGGFDARCDAAYAEVWPLQEGYEQRIILYRLYHELNHLLLFGRSYYQACLSSINALC